MGDHPRPHPNSERKSPRHVTEIISRKPANSAGSPRRPADKTTFDPKGHSPSMVANDMGRGLMMQVPRAGAMTSGRVSAGTVAQDPGTEPTCHKFAKIHIRQVLSCKSQAL